MADRRRTVLLARSGEARERLRAALEQAGLDVVLEADPLDTAVEQIRQADVRNLVIAVDAEVEDALDRFDPILADDRYRILFEEVALIGARDGWDAARWSRHLGAKLLGHGDVLPEGHESDEMPADVELAEAEPDTFGIQLEEVVTGETHTDQPDASSTEAPQDWSRFQDFEAVNELPAANVPQATDTDFRAALAPLDEAALPHDQAYERLEEEMSQFDAKGPADRWQDFERPAAMNAESESTPDQPVQPPVAPSWSLTDEPLPAAQGKAATTDGLAGLGDRISRLSLVDAEGAEETAEVADAVSPRTTPNEARGDTDMSGEGAVLLAGGIGGPDPLRQILQQLGKSFSVPVLVQQWLDGGQYDRLVRQMDRASQMPVELAEAGKPLLPGHVYIIPTAITVQRTDNNVMRFSEAAGKGFADVVSALPTGSSGVVLLSGVSQDFVEPTMRFLQAGGRVFAQSAEGCYDHAVPALLIKRGVQADQPSGLATQLSARWQQ